MKKLTYLCIFLLCMLFTACTEKDSEKFYMTTGLDIIDIGEINLIVENKHTHINIKEMVPDEYRDYDHILPISSLHGDVLYFVALIDGDGGVLADITQDIFSFNLRTGKLNHISNISQLETYIKSICEIKGDIYL